MVPEPSTPPGDPQTTLAWAHYLEEQPPEDRQTRLLSPDTPTGTSSTARAGSSPPGKSPWTSLLKHLYSSDSRGSVSVETMLETVCRAGHSRDEALTVLVPFAELPSVQQSWSDWQRVEERRELRLRLDLLERVSRAEGGLDSFLEFFFRASDPSLYQAAALAVGNLLPELPGLRTLVVNPKSSLTNSWNQTSPWPCSRNTRKTSKRPRTLSPMKTYS